MPTRDIRSQLEGQIAFNAAITTNTTTNGTIIDTADYDGGIKFDMAAIAYAGTGDYLPLLVEGNDPALADAAPVADVNIIGTEAGAAIGALTANTEVLKSIGYVGSNKRYCELRMVSTGVATGATIVAFAQKMPETMPSEGLSV